MELAQGKSSEEHNLKGLAWPADSCPRTLSDAELTVSYLVGRTAPLLHTLYTTAASTKHLLALQGTLHISKQPRSRFARRAKGPSNSMQRFELTLAHGSKAACRCKGTWRKGWGLLTQQQLCSKGSDARVWVIEAANQHCQHQELGTGAMCVLPYHGNGLEQGLLDVQPLLLPLLKQLLHLLCVHHEGQ